MTSLCRFFRSGITNQEQHCGERFFLIVGPFFRFAPDQESFGLLVQIKQVLLGDEVVPVEQRFIMKVMSPRKGRSLPGQQFYNVGKVAFCRYGAGTAKSLIHPAN